MTCEQMMALAEIAMLAKMFAALCWAGAAVVAVLFMWRP